MCRIALGFVQGVDQGSTDTQGLKIATFSCCLVFAFYKIDQKSALGFAYHPDIPVFSGSSIVQGSEDAPNWSF